MKSLRHRLRSSSITEELASKLRKSSSFSTRQQNSSMDGQKSRSTTPAFVGNSTSTSTTTSKKKKKNQSKFYNKLCSEKPTELFRTDLITNMTVSDGELLNNQYELISLTDPWRRDWNNGVQVPIYDHDPKATLDGPVDGIKFPKGNDSPTSQPPVAIFNEIDEDYSSDEDIPNQRSLRRKIKYEDDSKLEPPSTIGRHYVQYELDDFDGNWLRLVNAKLSIVVYPRFTLNESQLEKALERLEIAYALRCTDEKQSDSILRQQEDLDAVCDICRGEFSEEGNLLVFCEKCNVCIHQACYGIRRVPTGPWVCRPCALDVRPTCLLCPNRGGAFKPTKSGDHWVHVSCAVWIPEVEFGNPILKEPIIKVSKIPEERWKLLCDVCEEDNGACIQCSFGSCPVSYHVTCAQRAGWKVTYKELSDIDESGNVLENFCKKHSKDWPPASEDEQPASPSIGAPSNKGIASVPYKVLMKSTFTEFEQAFDRLQEVPLAFQRAIFNYWKAKRISAPERNLIFDFDECQVAVERNREAEFLCGRVDNLISLRQTLEKTRTLCYMIERREKLKRQWVDVAAQEFQLLSSLSDASGGRQMKNGFKTNQFLKTFPLSYEPTDWLPVQQKMTSLFSMIPPASNHGTTEGSQKKRGRPSKEASRADGAQSPLSTVNRPTPKRSLGKTSNVQKSSTPKSQRRLGSSSSEDEKNMKSSEFAQKDLKRKRTSRVHYSPM